MRHRARAMRAERGAPHPQAHRDRVPGRVDEGAALQEQAVEESTSQNGKDHRRTLLFRRNLVDYDLELGRLDDADRDIAAIDRAYRASPRPDITETTFHGSLVAQLALARGRPAEAERLARRALDEVARLPENQGSRGVILRALGSSLIAQRRFAEAEPVLTEALAIARRSKPRADQSAIYEIALAHAEAGLGKRGDAIARARAARDVLAHYPGQPKARREVAELLARIDPSSRPGRARP